MKIELLKREPTPSRGYHEKKRSMTLKRVLTTL